MRGLDEVEVVCYRDDPEIQVTETITTEVAGDDTHDGSWNDYVGNLG